MPVTTARTVAGIISGTYDKQPVSSAHALAEAVFKDLAASEYPDVLRQLLNGACSSFLSSKIPYPHRNQGEQAGTVEFDHMNDDGTLNDGTPDRRAGLERPVLGAGPGDRGPAYWKGGDHMSEDTTAEERRKSWERVKIRLVASLQPSQREARQVLALERIAKALEELVMHSAT